MINLSVGVPIKEYLAVNIRDMCFEQNFIFDPTEDKDIVFEIRNNKLSIKIHNKLDFNKTFLDTITPEKKETE